MVLLEEVGQPLSKGHCDSAYRWGISCVLLGMNGLV